MTTMLLGLALFVLPLGIDTFAVAAAAGASRPCGSTRWRISAVFVIFEGGMPLVGIVVGTGIGHAVGGVADYLCAALLVLLGGYLWWADDKDDEVANTRRLTGARGLALVGIALSISLDELAIGLGLGLGANLPRPAIVVAVITIQTLLVSQLGLSCGARISERWRERIERFTGPLLTVLGLYLLSEAFIRIGILSALGAVTISVLMAMFGSLTIYRRHAARDPSIVPRRRSSRRQRSGALTADADVTQ